MRKRACAHTVQATSTEKDTLKAAGGYTIKVQHCQSSVVTDGFCRPTVSCRPVPRPLHTKLGRRQTTNSRPPKRPSPARGSLQAVSATVRQHKSAGKRWKALESA
eukprot:4809509-Alexandrium_andersonii.AAC.1